ncbi:MAG: YjbE family putative metal transport protein [Thermomicrobiales bacterium]
MDLENLQRIFSIIVLDLVLSGDNAVVIGMAARNLDEVNRRKAILFGGIGAVGLRIAFTVLAALLLDVPLIQAVGGVLLILIAIRLISPETDHGSGQVGHARSLGAAVRTIILADVVMSLDNILAVGGTAEGHLGLLLFGLGLSIPLLLLGSTFIARVLQSVPWLLIVGVLILIHAAVSMFLHDAIVERVIHIEASEILIIAVSPVVALAVLGFVRYTRGSIAGLGAPAAH